MLKKIENLENKHTGSMTAIICGIFLFMSGVGPNLEETGLANANSIFGGISLFFGAIAYRLAKKRKLGTVNFFLVAIEIICISIVIFFISIQSREFIQENGLGVLIAGIVIIAYLRMVTAKKTL
jgi:hypothetical protein